MRVGGTFLSCAAATIQTPICWHQLLVQAIILLLFNEHEQLNFADIQAAVRLEEAELRRTLASLSVAKERYVWAGIDASVSAAVASPA